ncbi:hypothetical protein BH20ACT5_BH20ACT5_21540 [soil metagenome]
MSDELRDRFTAFASDAEDLSPPGLADVHHRRVRRQRTAVAATGLAVLAVLGTGAIWFAPIGDTQSIDPLGPPGPSAPIDSDTAPTPEPTTFAPTTAAPSTGPSVAPSGTPVDPAPTTASATASTVPPEEPATTYTIDFRSLVPAEDLDAAGIRTLGPDLGDADGRPTLPELCTASSFTEQYSNPLDFISGGYPVEGGTLIIDLLAYPSAPEASRALVKLKEDARACPTINEFASVSVTAVASSIGDEFVVFALDSESGEDGSVERIWITTARVDNVLVQIALDREPGFTGDVGGDEQITRTAAAANVAHLEAG